MQARISEINSQLNILQQELREARKIVEEHPEKISQLELEFVELMEKLAREKKSVKSVL